MTQRYRKLVATVGLAGAFAAAAVPTAMAKHGADDPPNHNANDNHGRVHDAERVHHHRGRGHDRDRDRARDARHGNGKDDPAGHDRGDDRGGDR
ncbi:MAG TPA: hypothetical protein VGF74_17435 [Thermoleophilaceae bacterium]|jgi:hypothetical protein